MNKVCINEREMVPGIHTKVHLPLSCTRRISLYLPLTEHLLISHCTLWIRIVSFCAETLLRLSTLSTHHQVNREPSQIHSSSGTKCFPPPRVSRHCSPSQAKSPNNFLLKMPIRDFVFLKKDPFLPLHKDLLYVHQCIML